MCICAHMYVVCICMCSCVLCELCMHIYVCTCMCGALASAHLLYTEVAVRAFLYGVPPQFLRQGLSLKLHHHFNYIGWLEIYLSPPPIS